MAKNVILGFDHPIDPCPCNAHISDPNDDTCSPDCTQCLPMPSFTEAQESEQSPVKLGSNG